MSTETVTFHGTGTVPIGRALSENDWGFAVKANLNSYGYNIISGTVNFTGVYGNGGVSFTLDVPVNSGDNIDSMAAGMRNILQNAGLLSNGSLTASLGWGQATGGTNTANWNLGGGSTYTVQSGDTFSKIAARYSMTVAQLKALNPQVANINVISVGQKLTVGASLPTATGGVTTPTNTTLPPTNTTTAAPAPKKATGSWTESFITPDGKLTGVSYGILATLVIAVATAGGGTIAGRYR